MVIAIYINSSLVNNNNIVININPENKNNALVPFGKENINVVMDKLGDIIKPLLDDLKHSIPRLLTIIHGSDDLKEYQNIYLPSLTSTYVRGHNGRLFENIPKNEAIDEIIESKRSIINDYLENNLDELGEYIYEKNLKHNDDIDSDKEYKNNIIARVIGTISVKNILQTDMIK